MAKHDSMNGSSGDFLLMHNQYLDCNADLGLTVSDDHHSLDVEQLGLGNSLDEHGPGMDESNNVHYLVPQCGDVADADSFEGGRLGFGRDIDPDPDQNFSNPEFVDEKLALGLNLAIENGDYQGLSQNQEMTSMMDPPILHSRALDSNIEHYLSVGQEFADVNACRRVLRDAAIAFRFEMQTIKSDKTRFTARCSNEGCPWRIHVAKLSGVPTFKVKTIRGEHNCGGLAHLGHQQASVQWVVNCIEDRLKENPLYTPKDILEEIYRVHGITVTYKQAWRAKERFMAAVRGSFEEEFRLLPQYCDQIGMSNPGSIAVMYGNSTDNCFQRLFVSFYASIYGFLNGCCPLIELDRISLKSKSLGALLIASGFDGEGASFPLAFGVVDEENDDSWMWFLSELHNLLETSTENMPKLTILSDRQKGIVDGINIHFPTAFHGYSVRHLLDSFQEEFKNTVLDNILWEAALALTNSEFEQKLTLVEEISQEAAYWIKGYDPRLWTTAYFDGTRQGNFAINTAQPLNSFVLEATGLPIIEMMEYIRRQVMTMFNERRETSLQWTSILVPSAERQWTSILVPSAERRVAEAIERARTYQVLKANDSEFEVIAEEGLVVVNIRTRHCLCCGWQLHGLPCAHAVAALSCCKQNVYRFTESCFTAASYRKVYSQTIHPVPDKALWKGTSAGFKKEGSGDAELLLIKAPMPPQHQLDRPRKRRQRARADVNRVKRPVHCSRCKMPGHFRTTCTVPM